MEPVFKKGKFFSVEVEEDLPGKHVVKDQKGTVTPMDPTEFTRLFAEGKLLSVGQVYQSTEPIKMDGDTTLTKCVIVHLGCTTYKICT